MPLTSPARNLWKHLFTKADQDFFGLGLGGVLFFSFISENADVSNSKLLHLDEFFILYNIQKCFEIGTGRLYIFKRK